MAGTKYIIRDTRKQHFRIDDAYVDEYARICGKPASLVYMSLCRHANREGESWPGLERIGKEMGINSKVTVIAAIRKLEKHGIVSVIRGKDKSQRQAVNVYVLLDQTCWVRDPSRVQLVYPEPGTAGVPSRVQKPGTASGQEGNTGRKHRDEGEIDSGDNTRNESVRNTLSSIRQTLEARGVLKPKPGAAA